MNTMGHSEPDETPAQLERLRSAQGEDAVAELQPATATACAWCGCGFAEDDDRVIVAERFATCGSACARFLYERLAVGGYGRRAKVLPKASVRTDAIVLSIQERLAQLQAPPPAARTPAPASRFGIWNVRRVLAAAFGKEAVTVATGRIRSREEDH